MSCFSLTARLKRHFDNLKAIKGATTSSGAVCLHAGTAGAFQLPHDLKPQFPEDIEQAVVASIDEGVFATELMNLKKIQPGFENLNPHHHATFSSNPEVLLKKAADEAPESLEEGTWDGTRKALTKTYNLVEANYAALMNICDWEPSLPRPYTIEEKRNIFVFSDPGSDNLPPHLNLGNPNDKNTPTDQWAKANPGKLQRTDLDPTQIFDKLRLAQISALLPALIPKDLSLPTRVVAGLAKLAVAIEYGPMGRPDEGQTLAEVEKYDRRQREKHGFCARNDIFDKPNIGDLNDWWSDQRFAQQQFTGTNPTSIETASDRWIGYFVRVATDDKNDQRMKKRIQDIATNERQSLYMQDYSYFREAAGIKASDEIKCEFQETVGSGSTTETITSFRWGVASVCLFHLQEDGMLQPLAIVLDWRGDEHSITIYNKELKPQEQKVDWPWRYAKTCVQASDWLRHEVTVHLTNTHFIEEATIVAAQRAFLDTHPVFQLLYPHWQKTLSLNAAARATLVPHVIIELIGLTQEQARKFIQSEFKKFDFKGRYVPQDLASRGFPPEKLNDPTYRNYAYARCIYSMWYKIRAYVERMLSIHYKKNGQDPDEAVKNDQSVRDWCKTLQADAGPGINDGADMKSFPTITTFYELIDAVTMCIHLASPQHTSINYLQNYYQAFVVNKPPCLYHALPYCREELDNYTEKDLVAALPMNHPREWLLASHIPYLLSFKPGDKESLISYAISKYDVYKRKTGDDDLKVKQAAALFYASLRESDAEFKAIAEQVWDKDFVKYWVLIPEWNAVSILL